MDAFTRRSPRKQKGGLQQISTEESPNDPYITYYPSRMAPRVYMLPSLVVTLRAPLKLPIVPGTTNAATVGVAAYFLRSSLA